MATKLDYSLEYALEDQYKNLYSWFIHEVDKSGAPLAQKWIPWSLGHSFALKGIRYSTFAHRILKDEFDIHLPSIPQSPAERPCIRRISGSLKPEGDREYSMFGTNRVVENMTFAMFPTSCVDTNEERITLAGVVGYTYSDVRTISEGDCLEVELVLKDEVFNQFVEHLLRGSVKASLHLGASDGFYSEWTPDVDTDKIKILNQRPKSIMAPPDQLLSCKDPSELQDFDPPRLGFVREFTLDFTSGRPPRRDGSDG